MKHLVLLLLLGGCVEHRPSPIAGQVSTLELQLLVPSMVGSPTQPIDAKSATFNVIARDDTGKQVMADVDAQVFLSFGGVKTGMTSACDFSSTVAPLTTLRLKSGALMNQTVQLPQAFGPATLWLDEPVSHAAGASPTIYFRDPRIPDVQTPPDLAAPNATFCTPFNRKFVIITEASGTGRLVVSSVFGNAFSVTDTGASTFNSIYVFSFGRPPDYIVRGRVLDSVSGNVSKFIGFTELNFPLFHGTDVVNENFLPPPVPLAAPDIMNIPKILGAVASEVTWTGLVCDPLPPNPNNDPLIQGVRDQWNKFNSFIADSAGTCDSFTNLSVQLPSKVVGGFDALQHVGKMVKFTGMLRNSSGQNTVNDPMGNPVTCDATHACLTGMCIEGECRKNPFNFWSLVVRGESDITVK